MEFPFDVSAIFPDGISVWDKNKVLTFIKTNPTLALNLQIMIDEMGGASAKV